MGCSASPATSSCRRRRVASSSRSHRRPAVSSPRRRRRVVVSRLGAARVAMFGPCRCVVAVSSPLVAVAVVVRVVFVARRRRRRRRRLYPHPALTASAGRRAVVCSPVSHGYPHPPALTTSAGRRAVVSSAPASILTAILTGILTVILAPDLTTHPQHLYLKPVMEGGCSDCEDLGLGALQRGWGCSGAWGRIEFAVDRMMQPFPPQKKEAEVVERGIIKAIRLRILRWNQHATVIAGRFGSGKSVALEEALRGMQGVYVHTVEDKDWKEALYKSLRMDDLGMLKEALRLVRKRNQGQPPSSYWTFLEQRTKARRRRLWLFCV